MVNEITFLKVEVKINTFNNKKEIKEGVIKINKQGFYVYDGSFEIFTLFASDYVQTKYEKNVKVNILTLRLRLLNNDGFVIFKIPCIDKSTDKQLEIILEHKEKLRRYIDENRENEKQTLLDRYKRLVPLIQDFSLHDIRRYLGEKELEDSMRIIFSEKDLNKKDFIVDVSQRDDKVASSLIYTSIDDINKKDKDMMNNLAKLRGEYEGFGASSVDLLDNNVSASKLEILNVDEETVVENNNNDTNDVTEEEIEEHLLSPNLFTIYHFDFEDEPSFSRSEYNNAIESQLQDLEHLKSTYNITNMNHKYNDECYIRFSANISEALTSNNVKVNYKEALSSYIGENSRFKSIRVENERLLIKKLAKHSFELNFLACKYWNNFAKYDELVTKRSELENSRKEKFKILNIGIELDEKISETDELIKSAISNYNINNDAISIQQTIDLFRKRTELVKQRIMLKERVYRENIAPIDRAICDVDTKFKVFFLVLDHKRVISELLSPFTEPIISEFNIIYESIFESFF